MTLAIYGSKDLDSRPYPVFTHNHNLCLMKDGKIINYLELERYTRKKCDNRLDLFIEEILRNKIIDLPEDFDFVLVNDFLSSIFISKNGSLRFESEGGDTLTEKLIPGTLTLLNGEFSAKKIKAWCCPHELAHIFSTLPFYGNLKENSLLFSFDGASSFGNYSSYFYKNGKLRLIENNWTDLKNEANFFNDNALVYKILKLERKHHTSTPGKLMGYASWGNYNPKIENRLRENNFFHVFQDEEKVLESINTVFDLNLSTFDNHCKILQDIAATFQRMFENAVIEKLRKLQAIYNCDYLYYGGGCALNIVTNTKIINSKLFKDVYIAPCCNDGGLSIGAASFFEFTNSHKISLSSPYICDVGITDTNYTVNDDEIEKTSNLLLQGKIIGICNGVAEAGPRALGNRSLIARADSAELSQKLSIEIKKREWYRPVAPIMLKEVAEEVAVEKSYMLAKYMLMDFHIKDEYKKHLEGVVHVNGTARIQIIEKEEDNPFMFRLLTLLKKEGVLALINTSFNVAGEPIVHTIEDAKMSARKMNLDGLVLNGKLYLKGNF